MGLLLLSLWWNAVAAGHDFHYSRTDVVYDPASRSWQVTLRVFTDDFEAELEARSPAGGPMRLGDSRQRADWQRNLARLRRTWVPEVPPEEHPE